VSRSVWVACALVLLTIGVALIAYSPVLFAQSTTIVHGPQNEIVLQETCVVGPRSCANYSFQVNLTTSYFAQVTVNGSLLVYLLNSESFAEWRETGEVHEVLDSRLATANQPSYLSMYYSGSEDWVYLVLDNLHSFTPTEAKEVVLSVERRTASGIEAIRLERRWEGPVILLLGVFSLFGSIALMVAVVGMRVGVTGKPAFEPQPSLPAPPPVRVCRYCGDQNPVNELLCRRCGEKLSTS